MTPRLAMIELEWIYNSESAILAAGRDAPYDYSQRKKKITEYLDAIDPLDEKPKSRLVTPEELKKAMDIHAVILTPDSLQISCDILNHKTISALNSEEIPF